MQQVGQPAPTDLLALPGGQRVQQHRVGRRVVLEIGAQAALLGQLAERVRAPGGLEQVGGHLGVVREHRGNLAERLGVVGDHRAAAERLHDLLGRRGIPGEHLRGAGRLHAEPPARDPARTAGRAASRVARTAIATSRSGSRSQVLDLDAGAQASREGPLGLGRGRGGVGRPERLLQAAQRFAQLEPAERVPELGAVRRRRRERLEVELDVDVALGGGELLGEARRLGVLGQVLLALGPGDVVDVIEDALEGSEPLQQVGRRLVADPRNARDVVAGVALQTDEVGDQLGRDAVAVDHPLAVVHPRVGDPPRGGHDLHHAVVDQLVGVAVAGHHHHRDFWLGGSRFLDDRGDHVIGLEPGNAEVPVAERVDQRLQVGPLLLEQVGAGGALGLVVRVHGLTPRVPGVPHDDGRLGAVVGEDLHQHRGEAEDRVGRHPGRGGDRLGQREEGPVGQAVAVDQEELVGHGQGPSYQAISAVAVTPGRIGRRAPGAERGGGGFTP